jgi:hypothetical protein
MRSMFARGLDLIEHTLDKAKAPVRFWWRDDDAGAVTPALTRLLSMSREFGTPVSLAVIPVRLEAPLIEIMREHRDLDVLVHGFAHRTHAPEGQPKCEFPLTRPIEEMRADMSNALALLREAFPQNTIPVFVPPWNRLPPQLMPVLKECGYVGFSAASLSPPESLMRKDGLKQSDGHFSLVAWKSTAQLADANEIAKRLAKQIRSGPKAPFCILTHHRAHNEEIWAFCEKFLKLLANHRNAEIVPARAIFC